MKRLILSAILIATIMSCKNKNGSSAFSDNSQTTAETASNVPAAKITHTSVYPTYNEGAMADLLKIKPNSDTLYVTNFFATWCGPCMVEIPHFKEEMERLKGQKVKFTFVDVDQPSDWATKVKAFGDHENLGKNIVLFDMFSSDPNFAKAHTETWDGNAIPFTRMTKGREVIEKLGALSKAEMQQKINELLTAK